MGICFNEKTNTNTSKNSSVNDDISSSHERTESKSNLNSM